MVGGKDVEMPALRQRSAELEEASAALAVSRCRAEETIARAKRIAGGLENPCHLAAEHQLAGRVRACLRR